MYRDEKRGREEERNERGGKREEGREQGREEERSRGSEEKARGRRAACKHSYFHLLTASTMNANVFTQIPTRQLVKTANVTLA